MSDLDLLRQYEPVVRYTAGELFFPCAVDGYLSRCHLWMADAERQLTLLAKPGELSTASLANFRAVPQHHRLFLQFVEAPLTAIDYQRWLHQPDRSVLQNPNRLQRLGLATRVLDGLFDLSLLVRGRVPGGTTAAAEVQYRAMQAEDPRRVYYGRVVRDGGYIILHYLFFFPMNDWRSSFHGVNDHESDWEQIFIYLTDEGDAPPQPRWVAFAAHDSSGDDLRRRWDDPEIQKVSETHPIIHAGAGSHASYFTGGEYLMQVEPQFLKPIHGVGAAIDRLWTITLRQGTPLNLDAGITSLLSIPFVDYARSDGKAIGPGQAETWTPILISDKDGWVNEYRGLWGLDTWDPLGGERAPSGPKYNRDGSVRLSWRAPLAWAGLDKVAPPHQAPAALTELLATLRAEQTELNEAIGQQRTTVRTLNLEVETLRSTEFLSTLLAPRTRDLEEAMAKLHDQEERLNHIGEMLEAGADQLVRLQAGDFGSARAHIQHANFPQPPIAAVSGFARWWAAVSGGLILLLVVALVYWRPSDWLFWLLTMIVLFGALDAVTRDRLGNFLIYLAMVLAIYTAAILIYEFWPLLIVLGLALLTVMMIRDNLREVFGR